MKHAIMILAHNNFNVVSALIDQFDAPEFDIYIHINAKVTKFPKEEWQNQVKRAKLYFAPRVAVGYCDYTMVEAVMSLFNTALKSHHNYYHLVSGADLLIKSRSEFLSFFEDNNLTEFVGFSSSFDIDRVYYKNYFIAACRGSSPLLSKIAIRYRKLLISCQKKLRLRKKIKYFKTVKKGCDWYSLTEPALKYLVSKEPEFKKDFYRSFCPTEFFPHTVLYNSDFCNKLYKPGEDESLQSLRTVDWVRGTPYVFTNDDKDFLLSSSGMFARKFDENKDIKIINFLKEYVKG